MDHRYDNWIFLHERLFAGEAHKKLEATFATLDANQLSQVFRNHMDGAVIDPEEVALRRTMDEWLSEISLLYVSWLSGYSGDSANTPEGKKILAILGHASLRNYYERYYPVALPWLFCLHLEEKISIQAEEAPGAFEYFATLHERFRNDRELHCFLDFLDGFQFGSGESAVRVETVIDAFSNPDRVVEAVFRPQSQLTPLDMGITGMLRFATFSTALYELLEKCQPFPVLQSAFWFFYAFWYREYKKDVKALSLGAIQKAASKTPDKGSQALASQSEQELESIMTALTDGRYSNALIEQVPAELLGTRSFEEGQESTAPENPWVARFSSYKKL